MFLRISLLLVSANHVYKKYSSVYTSRIPPFTILLILVLYSLFPFFLCQISRTYSSSIVNFLHCDIYWWSTESEKNKTRAIRFFLYVLVSRCWIIPRSYANLMNRIQNWLVKYLIGFNFLWTLSSDQNLETLLVLLQEHYDVIR